MFREVGLGFSSIHGVDFLFMSFSEEPNRALPRCGIANEQLLLDLKKCIESLSDAGITHLCSAKVKLGDHPKGPNAMMWA